MGWTGTPCRMKKHTTRYIVPSCEICPKPSVMHVGSGEWLSDHALFSGGNEVYKVY